MYDNSLFSFSGAADGDDSSMFNIYDSPLFTINGDEDDDSNSAPSAQHCLSSFPAAANMRTNPLFDSDEELDQ
jgi:hypothetical protein